MSRFRLLLVTIGVTPLILCWTAPATLIDGALSQLSGGHLRVVSASGTLWSGHGQLEIRDTLGNSVYASNIDWTLNKRALLLGRLSLSYHAMNQTIPTTVQLGFSSIGFTDMAFDLPAAALMSLLPAAQGYGLGGRLNFSSQSLSLTRSATVGTAVLRWQDASSGLAPVAPLGSYALHLVGQPSPVEFTGTLSTLRGPLQLDGTAQLGITQTPVVQIIAGLPENDYQTLAPFIRLIGVETAGNQFLIDL